MVGMFVGDEDGVHALGTAAAQRFKPAPHFLATVTGVDEEGGVFGFEQRGVARTARCQNGNPKGDASSPGMREAMHTQCREG